MTALDEQGALKQQFRSTIILGDFLDEASSMVAPVESNHAKLINEGLARGVQVQMGMGGAKSVAGGLNGANGAEAARLRDEKEAKEKARRRSTLAKSPRPDRGNRCRDRWAE